MLRRVNPTILLTLIIVIVLSFGLSAAAQTGEDAAPKGDVGSEGDPPKDAAPDETVIEGGNDQGDLLGTLEQKQIEADEAHWEHKQALSEERRVNDEIVQTNEDRTKTEEQLAEAEKQLGDRASEVYKYGNRGFLDALVGAKDLKEAAQVFDLWVRQLGQDRNQVEELRKSKDALEQQEKELKSQVEERKQVLEDAAAKKDAAQRARDDVQEFVNSLGAEERKDVEEKKAEHDRDATEAVRQLLDAPGQPKEESGDEASADQAKPMTEEDQARQTMMASAIDQTLKELSAQGMLPQKEGADESARNDVGNEGTQDQNHLADIANKQEQVAQEAKDAAEKVTAEQQAADKADEQAQAAENAKLAAQQASPEEQAKLQSAAEEAQRLADQAAQDAAQQKLAAQEATDKAAGDKAALPLVDPTTGTSVNPTTGTSVNPTTGTNSGSGVLGVADDWLGVPYKAGGDSRAGIDCSAFTRAVFQKFGLDLPDSPAGQMAMGTPVSRSELKPGDLVFFDEDGGGGPPTHVGIYMGNNMIIHASDYFMDVTETNMNYINGFIGGRRLL